MGKKLDPNVIRIGDQVKVIKPEFVERVGYPLSFDDACTIIAEKYSDKINEFMGSIFPETSDLNKARSLTLKSYWCKSKSFHRIVKALAYTYIDQHRFGGNERKIYTYTLDEEIWQNQVVYGKAVVKTGLYYGPSGGHYPYEDDFEPGGLDKCKTHMLLNIGNAFADCKPMFSIPKYYGWIEACNVEKVK